MVFLIDDEKTEQAVQRLVRLKRLTFEQAILEAVEAEYQRFRALPLAERIKPIQDEFARYPETGLKADKAFFDELSGDED